MITKIIAREWDYTCGDGCCYEWGVNVWITDDGVETEYDEPSVEDAILKHLGVSVEWDYTEEVSY